MLTYHNNPLVKEKYLNRVHQHRIADHLTQGIGWDANYGGCAVGCTLESYDHSRYPIELGLPEWLAFLEDHIFEALPEAEAMNWPEQFMSAISVGIADRQMDILRDQFQVFWLTRQKSQIDCEAHSQVAQVIDNTINLLQQAINGTEPVAEAWSAAKAAARAAAWSAAESAAWAAAESAAASAARAAARAAAWSAAWSAAESAAKAAAESAARAASAASAASAAWSAAESAAESAAKAAAESAARAAASAAWSTVWSTARAEAIVKRDWLLENLAKLERIESV